MNGLPIHEYVLELGVTPDLLISKAGFEQLELAIKASTIAKICFDHGIPTSMIKRLPDIIQNPKSIYNSATHPDSVVVVTFEIKGNENPVIIPIKRNVSIGRNSKYNLVTSAYGKEGSNPEAKWAKDGLLVWPLN